LLFLRYNTILWLNNYWYSQLQSFKIKTETTIYRHRVAVILGSKRLVLYRSTSQSYRVERHKQ